MHKLLKETDLSVVELHGKITSSNSEEFERIMNQAFENETNKIIIDCTQLEYVTSSGLRIFLTSLKKSKNEEIDLVICGLNNNIMDIFLISKFESLFTIAPDMKSARKQMNGKTPHS